jgi:hypothetical protein
VAYARDRLGRLSGLTYTKDHGTTCSDTAKRAPDFHRQGDATWRLAPHASWQSSAEAARLAWVLGDYFSERIGGDRGTRGIERTKKEVTYYVTGTAILDQATIEQFVALAAQKSSVPSTRTVVIVDEAKDVHAQDGIYRLTNPSQRRNE